jgi:hypothetical protein
VTQLAQDEIFQYLHWIFLLHLVVGLELDEDEDILLIRYYFNIACNESHLIIYRVKQGVNLSSSISRVGSVFSFSSGFRCGLDWNKVDFG